MLPRWRVLNVAATSTPPQAFRRRRIDSHHHRAQLRPSTWERDIHLSPSYCDMRINAFACNVSTFKDEQFLQWLLCVTACVQSCPSLARTPRYTLILNFRHTPAHTLWLCVLDLPSHTLHPSCRARSGCCEHETTLGYMC